MIAGTIINFMCGTARGKYRHFLELNCVNCTIWLICKMHFCTCVMENLTFKKLNAKKYILMQMF